MNTSPYPSTTSRDRRLQIEILRLRASYERLEALQAACELKQCLQPAAMKSVLRDGLHSMGLGSLGSGLSWLRSYPLLMSLAGSLLANRKRRRILFRAALIGGLAWLGKRSLDDGK